MGKKETIIIKSRSIIIMLSRPKNTECYRDVNLTLFTITIMIIIMIMIKRTDTVLQSMARLEPRCMQYAYSSACVKALLPCPAWQRIVRYCKPTTGSRLTRRRLQLLAPPPHPTPPPSSPQSVGCRCRSLPTPSQLFRSVRASPFPCLAD